MTFFTPGRTGASSPSGSKRNTLQSTLPFLPVRESSRTRSPWTTSPSFPSTSTNTAASPNNPIAIVNQDGESLVVQIIHQKRLDFIRILPDNVDQLADTFRFYRMKRPGLSVGEIYLAR